MSFTVHFASQSALFAHVDRRLALMVWRQFDDSALNGLESFISEQVKWKTPKWAAMGIIEEGAKLPGSSFRERSAELLSQTDTRIIAMSGVFMKKGLMATALRSAATGIALLSRSSHPMKLFSEISEGSRWLVPFAQQTGLQISVADLSAGVEKMRLQTSL